MSRPAVETRQYLAAGTLVAAISTAGSLYFSRGMGLTPCDLCWYQRIFMYPLVVILVIGAYQRNDSLAPIVLSLSVPGALLAAYHSYIQYATGGVGSCTVGGGCTAVQYELLGLSIPNMALLGFLLITGFTIVSTLSSR
ncbi:disulfide bond formation protein B [Natranaeroarchaeum aerophilus]|uniref:Disulfide bond formation protein B n=1 Tax=Natranaeroarchaeum aerophilus TaxID=2917711 RepID=A0AAE3K6E2_9EURY|nr:disulfide bond formation protein B [Natranaeroarchaeum aerophilus]MCL9815142.1 disulfide bond formation protein B [Natranaeroarchaeum aerophilus]